MAIRERGSHIFLIFFSPELPTYFEVDRQGARCGSQGGERRRRSIFLPFTAIINVSACSKFNPSRPSSITHVFTDYLNNK